MAEDKDENENSVSSLFDTFDKTDEGKVTSEEIEYESDSEDMMSGIELEVEDMSEEESVEESGGDEQNAFEEPPEEDIKPSVESETENQVSDSAAAEPEEESSMMIPSVDIAEIDESYQDDATVVSDSSEFSTESDDVGDIDVIENDPDFSGDELSVDGQIDMNTEDKDEENKDFMSFEEACGTKKKKKSGVMQLNKKRIIYTAFGVIMALGLFMILKPESWTIAKKESKNKPTASKAQYTNYEGAAKNSSYADDPIDVPRPEFNDVGVNSKYSENSSTDPRQAAYQEAYNQQGTQYVGSGTGYTVEIPDTRNDRLQGKTIAGIKGLTSTQDNYATDYNLQKEKNSAEAASNSRVTGTSSLRNTDPTQYTEKLLSAMNTSNYTTQNDQAGKQGFYNNGRGTGGNGMWLGLNTIWQGTIFDVILTSEINTDLPGEVTGRVSKNVYSSQDGRYLLIPQNSVLIGNYNSSISYAQSRAQVIWHTLIRPDGYQVNLGAMNGTDTKGAAGLKGFVNDHPMAYLKAIALMSTFSIINGEFQATQAETNNQYVKNIAANSQEMVNKLGEKLIDRAMDVQPTIVIKSGTQINVVVNQNLTLPEYKKPEVTQPYQKGKLPRELY